MKKLIVFISIMCIGITFVGCEKQQSVNISAKKIVSQNDTRITSKIESTKDFINLLEKSGCKINSSTQESKGFLSGSLTAIKINTDIICVYEYKDNQQMEKDLKTISSDGSWVGNAIVDWVKTPHIYKNENIIAIYVGDNNEMIEILKKLLGQQFAGDCR